ncbi:MAG: hypothetical protein EXS14_02995 [Planctomycetes bacterium]|nr:hypothetical protein [Planctomycetota bacterium]
MRHHWLLLLVLALPLAGQVTATPEIPPTPRTLHIAVRWEGELPPAPTKVRFDPAWAKRNPDEAQLCGRCADEGKLVDESLLVDAKNRGIANVAFSLGGLESAPTKFVEPLLDNLECRFTPRVQFAAARHALRVRNSDPFAHTARLTNSGGHLLWNALIANAAETKTSKLPRAGLHTVLCDMHPWMRAHVIATNHPFVAVSATDGSAQISGIPQKAAKHTLVAWHEKLGTARSDVDFAAPSSGSDALGVFLVALRQQDFRAR